MCIPLNILHFLWGGEGVWDLELDKCEIKFDLFQSPERPVKFFEPQCLYAGTWDNETEVTELLGSLSEVI